MPKSMGRHAHVVAGLGLAVVLVACSTTAPAAATTPVGPATSVAGGTSTAAASQNPPTSAPVSGSPSTAGSIASGPKATTCHELLSDGEVSQATSLANATLKTVDVAVAIGPETHCRFDAGTTEVEVGVWSGDRLAAFDTTSSGMTNPAMLDVAGASATFYDLSFIAVGLARTADHGVSINLTPGDRPIPDMKAATTALLRLVLGRI